MTIPIEWIRRGVIEIAELPDGKTAAISHRDDRCVMDICDKGGVTQNRIFRTANEAREYIEKKYSLKPLATGPDWSFWVSEDKTRAVFVHSSNSGIHWWVIVPHHQIYDLAFPTREAAEAAAAQYVRGEA